MEMINMLNKTRMRFARRRTKPVDGALAALATLSCCISTVDPKNASAWEPDDGCSPEQQLINRTMHALQRNLEAPLLRTGWKTGNERPARPHLPFAGSREPIHPLTMAPSARIDKIDVPGVPLAIQLSTADRQSSSPEIETQLCWGMPSGVNMVVYIRATRQVTAELLQKIDWRQVGEGLEP